MKTLKELREAMRQMPKPKPPGHGRPLTHTEKIQQQQQKK